MVEMKDLFKKDLDSINRFLLPWENLNGRNILVTGATGIIGSCVVKVLMNKNEGTFNVYASGRNTEHGKSLFSEFLNNPFFHFLKLDVTSTINIDINFDYIVDAAGGANPKLYQEHPVSVMKSNIMGVDNLLSYGVSHGLRRFVYISSGEIYGEGDGRIFKEDYSGYVNPTNIRSCYPSAKRASETLSVSYGKEYGLDVIIARPSHVYGPDFTESDNRVYAQFIRNVIKGEDIVLRSKGDAFRSWTYVVDCANALLTLLFEGMAGEAYNIADDNSNITIKELAELCAEIGKRKVIFDIPSDCSHGVTTPITKAVFDTQKLRDLGWRPLFSIKDGLTHTIQSRYNSLY